MSGGVNFNAEYCSKRVNECNLIYNLDKSCTNIWRAGLKSTKGRMWSSDRSLPMPGLDDVSTESPNSWPFNLPNMSMPLARAKKSFTHYITTYQSFHVKEFHKYILAMWNWYNWLLLLRSADLKASLHQLILFYALNEANLVQYGTHHFSCFDLSTPRLPFCFGTQLHTSSFFLCCVWLDVISGTDACSVLYMGRFAVPDPVCPPLALLSRAGRCAHPTFSLST